MLRTASQRRDLCRTCPVARVADIIGDSCSLLIIRDLLESPRRYGELLDSLKGISSRTLTNKLKLLEKEGLVRTKKHRGHAYPEYALTQRGLALKPVVDSMRAYGKRYL